MSPFPKSLHRRADRTVSTARLTTAVIAVWVSLASLGNAADFQVVTKVFRGANPNPAATIQTIFQGNKVYDIATTAPRQATVIDYDSGQITILDPQRQVKVTLKTQDVLQISTFMKMNGKFPDEPLWNFLRDPEFKTEYDEQLRVLNLAGNPLIYEADLDMIDQQDAVDDYRRFCDWSAQLNFICGGGALPQARLDLNSAICQRAAVPREIRKIVRGANPANNMTARSTHEFQWAPDANVTKLVGSIEADLGNAKSVTFEEYVRPVIAAVGK